VEQFEHYLPHLQAYSAAIPVIGAILLRVLLGRSKFIEVLLTLTTLWFAVNVMVEPFGGVGRVTGLLH
jgi:hypothetical protein